MSRKIRTARKNHICTRCGCPILKGLQYIDVRSPLIKFQGKTLRYCLDCDEETESGSWDNAVDYTY